MPSRRPYAVEVLTPPAPLAAADARTLLARLWEGVTMPDGAVAYPVHPPPRIAEPRDRG